VPHPLDIICIVKRRASDGEACQKPVMYLPHNRAVLLTPLPTTIRPRTNHRLCGEWLTLAELLVLHVGTESAGRTAQYLLKMATGRLGNQPLVDLPLLRTGIGGIAYDQEVNSVMHATGTLQTLLPVMAFKVNIKLARSQLIA
jgi:hypothetical protein